MTSICAAVDLCWDTPGTSGTSLGHQTTTKVDQQSPTTADETPGRTPRSMRDLVTDGRVGLYAGFCRDLSVAGGHPSRPAVAGRL
jgi:hypothetical protein